MTGRIRCLLGNLGPMTAVKVACYIRRSTVMLHLACIGDSNLHHMCSLTMHCALALPSRVPENQTACYVWQLIRQCRWLEGKDEYKAAVKVQKRWGWQLRVNGDLNSMRMSRINILFLNIDKLPWFNTFSENFMKAECRLKSSLKRNTQVKKIVN